MTDLAIRVENPGKQYRIGTPRARYKTLRESLTSALAAPFRNLRSNPQSAIRNPQSEGAPFRRIKLNDHKTTDNTTTDQSPVVSSQPSPSPVVSSPVVSGHHEWLWALKDVSFDVKQGEVVGIPSSSLRTSIGRNGAGKSTLLKILSRITAPTAGRAMVSGRVGSLLEVGTGFHPELTGRGNTCLCVTRRQVYLNGAILGMRKVEIARKFDEIVAFTEIEKFLDTPVRHYSSGMYVRLAFAVAAHLKPEILLLDEALAVGEEML